MKILKKTGLVLFMMLLIAQFFGPEKNEGDLTTLDTFLTETNPPEEVKVLMKNACFDCHSNTTRYPWYASITPVNYWLADHVNHGKGELNFSEWADFSLRKKRHKMKEVAEEVEKKAMPLDSYTWTHADARFSPEQIKALVTWAKKEHNRLDNQYKSEQ